MALEETDASQSLVPASSGSLALTGDIKDSVSLAQLMAKAKAALPAHLHNNPGECLAIVMMAQTWGMNPYMVGPKTCVINNRLMYEGQLVSAVVNKSGFLQSRLQFETEGEGEALKVTVSGLIKGESQPRTLVIGMPKPGEARNSPLWKTQPEQQLIYKAIRTWARRYLPEVLMGVYTPEDDFSELPREMIEVKQSNAKAVDNRLSLIASSPMLALDTEGVEEIQNDEDVFTSGASAKTRPEEKSANDDKADDRGADRITDAVPSPSADNRSTSEQPSEGEEPPTPKQVEKTAAAAADLFSQQASEHSAQTRSSSSAPTDEDLVRQDYIDAGPVIEDVLLCPETSYEALRQDVLKKIASRLSAPADLGLEATADAFTMIGGQRLTKAMNDKGIGMIAGKVRQAFGVRP